MGSGTKIYHSAPSWSSGLHSFTATADRQSANQKSIQSTLPKRAPQTILFCFYTNAGGISFQVCLEESKANICYFRPGSPKPYMDLQLLKRRPQALNEPGTSTVPFRTNPKPLSLDSMLVRYRVDLHPPS